MYGLNRQQQLMAVRGMEKVATELGRPSTSKTVPQLKPFLDTPVTPSPNLSQGTLKTPNITYVDPTVEFVTSDGTVVDANISKEQAALRRAARLKLLKSIGKGTGIAAGVTTVGGLGYYGGTQIADYLNNELVPHISDAGRTGGRIGAVTGGLGGALGGALIGASKGGGAGLSRVTKGAIGALLGTGVGAGAGVGIGSSAGALKEYLNKEEPATPKEQMNLAQFIKKHPYLSTGAALGLSGLGAYGLSEYGDSMSRNPWTTAAAIGTPLAGYAAYKGLT